MTFALLGLRFIIELCLLAAFVVIGWGVVDNHLLGALVGVALALVVALIWGMLLSPRRKIDLPLAVRVVVEFVLFATAALGLAAVGLASWGVALLAADVVVVAVLAMRGLPPGSDTVPADAYPVHARDAEEPSP